jgi:hypothetical protein
MDRVGENIEEARRLLAEGDDKRAADLLTTAASECRDPTKAALIHSLALQGQERAGRFSRKRWDEPLRVSKLRLAAVESS